MRSKVLTVVACLLFTASAHEASAQIVQPWTDRGYFNFNVGFETASGTLADARTFRLPNDTEDATLAVSSGVDSGALIDFSVGSRAWRNVSLGIGYHRGSTSGEGTLEASVPNPFLTDRPRDVALPLSDLDRTEQAIHLLFGYMLPLSDELSVHLTLGPSFFRLNQEVVSDATFTEQGFPLHVGDRHACDL